MLSAVSFSACDPLGLTYPHDPSFKITQDLYAFADGFNMYISPLTHEARDVALNKHELVVLSDYVSLEDCIDQTKKSDASIQFASTINVSGIGFWATDGTAVTITPDKGDDSNVFIFKFDPATETVQVIFENVRFLTYNDTTNQLDFQDESLVTFNGVSPQIFNYIVDGNKIVLFTNFAFLSSQYTVSWNSLSSVVSATSIISPSGGLPTNSTFILAELPDTLTSNNYAYGQSNWVQYRGNLDDLSIKRSLSSIPQNILVTAPYKALSGDQFMSNVNGLKNHLTPDYDLNIDNDNSVNQRDYYGLYTGANQEGGYENVFLAYEGGTQGITFKKGKFTWFHYPNSAPQIAVNDTTIAVNGAVASNTPYKSDKIFKKQANYKKYSTWGDSLPVYEQNGTWLCTWLSGSPEPDTIPVWINRYINPTLTGAISGADDLVDLLLTANNDYYIGTQSGSALEINGNSFITKVFKNYQQAYIDTPSTMTFDPGVLYVYHHLGEVDNRTIVSQLSGDTRSYFISSGEIQYSTNQGTEQMLYISDWSQLVSKDNSPFVNDINMINTPNIARHDDVVHNTFSTNASAYGITKFPVNFAPYNGFTVSVNVSADDWSNLYGDQIIGNSFDGGFGLFVDNPVITPLFYVYETTQGRNLELNSDLYILQESKLSNIPSTSAVQFLFKRDYDEEYFVIDSGKNVLRYDSANILLSATSVSATVSGTILDAQIDGVGHIYIMATNGVYRYDVENGNLAYQFSTGASTKLQIDLNNEVSILPPTIIDYAIDSKNNAFTVSTTGIFKNGTQVLAASAIKKINCDIHDNLWVIHDNKLSKLSNHPYKLSTTTLSSGGDMSMTFGYNLKGNGVREEYIVVVDETNKRITKLDLNGTILSSSLISTLSGQFIVTGPMSFRLAKGDPSGYDYQRKYARVQHKAGGIHIKVFTNHQATLRTKVFKLFADVSHLTSGFHNFAVSFDTSKGNIKLFIDSEIVARSSSDVNAYQFAYRPTNYRNEVRFVVGASSAKNGTLLDKIKQSYAYIFNGGFNELRIYNAALSEENVRYAARNAYKEIYSDMVWNMPVGTNQYLEEIERFFQHRMPGNKSQFFNIRIRGYKPATDEVKEVFENSIRDVIVKIVPAYTQLKDIVWIQ